MGTILKSSDDTVGVVLAAMQSDPVIDLEEDDEDYSIWFQDGSEFIPSLNMKSLEEIPAGAYRIVYRRDDIRVVPVPINTDELYSFSEDFTSKIISDTELFWEKKDLYKQNKLTHKRGILLCGRPGCGKTAIITMLTEQIIKNNGLVFIATNPDEFGTLYDTIGSVVRKIEKDRPIITIIEDVDQLIDNMRNDSMLLDFLDGKHSIDHHLVILTSNDTTDLSEALLRPSRIDTCIEIPSPTAEVRREYFIKKGVKEEDLDEFTDKTDDFSFAELKEVFIGTYILGKDLDKVIEQIMHPHECKDYLNRNQELKGID